ncbi:MAG: ATP-binding protein [Balneolaceae bacterium]
MNRLLLILLSYLLLPLYSNAESFLQDDSIQALYSEIEQMESDSLRIELKIRLVEELVFIGEFEKSRDEISQVLRLATLAGNEDAYLRGLLQFANYHLQRGYTDSAMVAIQEGLYQSREEPSAQIEFLDLQATAYRVGGRPEASLEFLQQALVLADSLDLHTQRASVLRNRSASQRRIGDFSGAFESLYHALVYAEDQSDMPFMILVLNDIGELFNELGEFSEAIYYLERGEQIARERNNRVALGDLLVNLGRAKLGTGDADRAIDLLQEAYEISEETGVSSRISVALYHLGMAWMERGEYQTAMRDLAASLESSRESEFFEGQVRALIGIGKLAQIQSRYGEASLHYQEALEISRKFDLHAFTTRALQSNYELYKEVGDVTQTLTRLEALREHEEWIRSAERERIRGEFEVRLDIRRQEENNRLLMARQEEQEARIRLQRWLSVFAFAGIMILGAVTLLLFRSVRLRKEMNASLKERNEEIVEQNSELDRLNSVKNRMFAIVAHDLRGPLGSLQSLLYLMREHDLSKEEMDEITNSLEQSLHNNAITMENLLAWAHSQMNGINLTLRTFDLYTGVHAVYSQIHFQAEEKGVEISIDVDSSLKVRADYDVVKLVVRNLVSNSVKFCSKGDTITIGARPDDKMIQVCIKDTGTGIRTEDQSKIFGEETYTRKGTGNEKGSGLGLTLCKEFIETHGGEIWFESEWGSGTAFFFTLPAEELSEEIETEEGDDYARVES